MERPRSTSRRRDIGEKATASSKAATQWGGSRSGRRQRSLSVAALWPLFNHSTLTSRPQSRPRTDTRAQAPTTTATTATAPGTAATAATHAAGARGGIERSCRKLRPVPQGRVAAPHHASPSGATSGATSGTGGGSGTGVRALRRRELRALALRLRERRAQRLELR